MRNSVAAKVAGRTRGRAQSAVILAIEPQTPRIHSVFLAPERPFSFVPGQYVSVRVPARGGSSARKYSIASAPEAGAIIELAVEAVAGGEVSGWFHRSAVAGDTVEIGGPRGDFTWSVGDGGPILLIAGGSGLAPLMSMIRHRAARRSSIPVGLVYSASTWADVLFRDELLELARAETGFQLTITLTREPRARSGTASGRIERTMLEAMLARLPAAASGVYICGSDPFVEQMRTLVEQLGVAAERIRLESFGS